MRPYVGNRVLFIGHEATRTGAPLMLLHLLRWLRDNTDIDFDLLIRRDGPLVGEYERICHVLIDERPRAASSSRSSLKRIIGSSYLWRRRLLAKLGRRNIGLIYSNTVTNSRLLESLSSLGCPTICHAHEVESFIHLMPEKERGALACGISHFIALTDQMVQSLVSTGVPRHRITKVPGFISPAVQRDDLTRRTGFRDKYGIPHDVILIGGCGTVHWQKGPDLLVHIANKLTRRSRSNRLHFAWLGGFDAETNFKNLRWDIEASNLSRNFLLVPSSAETAEYMRSLDIFALTSRNDPSPMVALEAGAQGVPVVCFAENAVMVDDQSGRVVPYLDLDGFADAIEELADDEPLRADLGNRLASKILARHDVSVNAPAIVDIVRSFLHPGGATGLTNLHV